MQAARVVVGRAVRAKVGQAGPGLDLGLGLGLLDVRV